MRILGNIFASNFRISLLEAAETGNTTAVQQLLKKGANVDDTNSAGHTPLLLASNEGHADVVKLLLDAHANVNAAGGDGYTPLYVASQGGHADVVKLVLAASAKSMPPMTTARRRFSWPPKTAMRTWSSCCWRPALRSMPPETRSKRCMARRGESG
jgi:hypothetical protein